MLKALKSAGSHLALLAVQGKLFVYKGGKKHLRIDNVSAVLY